MWTKICGITRVEDAGHLAELGVSAMGLNFFRGSKRFVPTDRAVVIARAAREKGRDELPPDVVGVFVNSSVDEVVDLAEKVSLTAVQFHGDESVELIAEFHQRMPGTQIIRAIRVTIDNIEEQLKILSELQREVPLAACLLDAFVVGEFGGTGVTIDPRIPEYYLSQNRPRLILAGGLTPTNLDGSIARFVPWGVDTASGVESSPGIKDAEKCRQFIKAAGHRSSSAAVRL